MNPAKLTDAGHARIREVAAKQIEIPSVKTLAKELRVSENYVRQLLSMARRAIAPRETE